MCCGLARACAAVAAARLGRKAALVHNRPVLGGKAWLLFFCGRHVPLLSTIWYTLGKGQLPGRHAIPNQTKAKRVMRMARSLEGKTAVVTGGSRGLGRWISHALAVNGAAVAVNYARSEADALETVRLIAKDGGRTVPVQADITSEDEVEFLIDEAVRLLGGPVDILVNNATGPQPMYSIEASTWDIYLDQLNYFVKAPLLLTKACLPGMKSKRSGAIVNIGSEVVQLGSPNFSSYVAAKSAMIGMTRSWANELGPFGIRVNLVAPGFIPVERHEGMNPEDLDRYSRNVPLRHMGEPYDVAAAVAFLASDEAKFITGQCLSVNGGNTFGI